MGVKATVEAEARRPTAQKLFSRSAPRQRLLIGRKGQTLEALQYLVSRIAGERFAGEGPHIVIDIENYRERRRRSLEDMALRLGEKAKRQRKTVTVDALSAADRRIIHAALARRPLGVDEKSRPRLLSPASDYSRRGPQKKAKPNRWRRTQRRRSRNAAALVRLLRARRRRKTADRKPAESADAEQALRQAPGRQRVRPISLD